MDWPPPLERLDANAASEDWEAVTYDEARRMLGGAYHSAEFAILLAALGQPVRTPFAFYRVAPDAPAPPEDWSWRAFYGSRLTEIITDSIYDGEGIRRVRGYTQAARDAWNVVDMLSAYGSGLHPHPAIKSAKRAGLEVLAGELGDLKQAIEERERDAHRREVERGIEAVRDWADGR